MENSNAEATSADQQTKSKGKRWNRNRNRSKGANNDSSCDNVKTALYEKLFFGYSSITNAIKNIELNQITRTVNIPITTRSIGFILNDLMAKFAQLRVLNNQDLTLLVHASYRVALLCIEVKLEEARNLQHSRNLDMNRFLTSQVTSDVKKALRGMGANFAPVVNYVSAIGYFKTTSAEYMPRHPRSIGRFDYLHVSITNLREVVQYLSSQGNESVQHRIEFRNHCPIPGAEWNIGIRRGANEENADIPVLSNPDDIIPADYNITQVFDDLAIIGQSVEVIGRRYPKYVSSGAINYTSPGSICQLVSNNKASIKCPSLGGMLNKTTIIGKHDRFWSPIHLSDPEFYMGVAYMLGEIDSEFMPVR